MSRHWWQRGDYAAWYAWGYLDVAIAAGAVTLPRRGRVTYDAVDAFRRQEAARALAYARGEIHHMPSIQDAWREFLNDLEAT